MEPKELERMKDQLKTFFMESKVKKAILFGSIAKDAGTKRSDLDILIVMDTDKRFFERYENFEKIYSLLKGKSIDLLIYTPDELERIAHRPFIKRILDEGQAIYEH